MSRSDPRPTMRQLMNKHRISLKRLITSVSTIQDERQIMMIANEGIGTPADIDACLSVLSDLSKHIYNRETVGGFTFLTPQDATESARHLEVRTLKIPVGTPEHFLKALVEHGALVGEEVHPPLPEGGYGYPASYWVVVLPLGVFHRFLGDRGGAPDWEDQEVRTTFPDGYILRTRLTKVWGMIYDIVISDVLPPDEEVLSESEHR